MPETVNHRNIKKEIQEKLQDGIMRDALSRFADQYPDARLHAYENVESIEELRDSLSQMKKETVAHIEEVADQFEQQARARGVEFYRAADGDDLKRFLLQICRENDVHRIVKSKSMATEEIHLNKTLEENGLHVRETDLGEWMLSVAGQRPSHMVLPAIHLDRHQCAKFFSDELQREIPSDISYMIQTARQVLREEFLSADMGITGANFGIAENGAIGLVTNEGNARLVTTLPRIHVVILGYEKLVPKITDAAKILRLLPRNGTCQRMTSYMTMVDGPTPVIHKKDGAYVEEMRKVYYILLDNGRLKAAHHPRLKSVYQCVRCASCLNVCPIWTLVGGHVYGHVYSGGIGAILTGILGGGMDNFSKFSDLCIGCRKCTTICPGKIPIPDLIQELRESYTAEHGLSLPDRAVFQNILANRKVFHTLLRIASAAQKPVASGGFIRHLPLFFAGMTKGRSLPAIAERPLRDRTAELLAGNPAQPIQKAAFFSGCNIDFIFPDTGSSVFRVLQDLSIEVCYPQAQSCCGKPVLGMGDRETAKKMAKQNIEAFAASGADIIVCACPTCAEMLQETYPELLADEPEWQARARDFAGRVREFTSLAAAAYRAAGRLQPQQGGPRVTYHDSCHLKRGLGIADEPRALLQAAGCTLVEMKDSDKCCGMAGAFGVKYSEISLPMLQEKLEHIAVAQADIVAAACPACMMQLRGGMDQSTEGIPVRHVADILAEHLPPRPQNV